MKNLFSRLLCVLVAAAPISLSAQGPDHVPGDVLVMIAPNASAHSLVGELARLEGTATGLVVVREVSTPMRAWLLHFDEQAVPEMKMLRALQGHAAVQLAQYNHFVKERVVPNDATYAQQWHHQNINSEEAWDITTGGVTATGDTIVVCIIEDADLGHVDLSANAWINRAEIPNNGIDDDGNGYVDDRRGWNTPDGNDDVYSGSHGTQCAGMIGATGNNGIGVTGANWKVKMMPVNYGGVGEAAVVAAYTYPLVMRRRYNASNGLEGAFVVATSASWGIDGGQPEDSPLWCAMYDTLGTAGILNCGATANNDVDIDVVGDLPTACASDFMISVTATNNADQRTFSAWGLTTIDVGAPGEDVRTTSIGGGYGSTSGTSFACPLTAGVIGLLYSTPCASMMALVHADPEEGARYVRTKLFEGVDQVGNLPGNTVTGGRINSGTSVQLIMAGCGTCPAPFGGSASRVGTDEGLFSWTATTAGPFNVRYRAVGAANWIDLPGIVVDNVQVSGIEACTAYEFQVAVVCVDETSDFSNSTILAPPAESAPTISASGYEVACANSGFTLTSSSATGNVWSTTEQTQNITPQTSGTYTVTFSGLCGTYTSAAIEVTIIDPPAPPTADDVQLPGPGTAMLNAVGDNISWYNMATGGAVVGAGNSWTTPLLNATTNFWCTSAATNSVTASYGAKTDRSTSGLTHNNSSNYQLFTAYESFIIRSVKVYAVGAGNRIIGLENEGSGTTVVQGTFAIPDGESRVQLDMVVPAAGNYGLRIMNGDPQLWRDGIGSNPTYPYALGTFGSMTSSTVLGNNATEYYYFFYDWEVEPLTVRCESERVEVTVELPTGIGAINDDAANLRVFPDPADRDIFFNLSGPDASGRLLVTVLDLTGRQVALKIMENGRATLTTADMAEGLYVYRISNQVGEVATGRFMVSHIY